MIEPTPVPIRVPRMWRRFVAFAIDFVMTLFLFTMGLGAYLTYVDPNAAVGGAILVFVAVLFVTNVLPVAFWGGSLGQLALGLQVARLDGQRLSLLHVLVRLATFLVYFPWGAVLGGFVGVLAAMAAGATGEAVLTAVSAGALVGLLAWIPMAIVGNSLGLAYHDAISRSIVVRSGDARPFAAVLVPRSARQAKREWAGIGAFALTAYLVATSALALPASTGDLSAGGAPLSTPTTTMPHSLASTGDLSAGGVPAATDVMVTGTVYVPKGQQFSVTPVPPTTSGPSRRPRGLASLGAGWCSGKSCDVLANARVRFVAPSRYGWQPFADAGLATTADAQGSYRMVLPQRYAAAPTPTYVMATDPGERLAVIAEVAMNQQRPGVGITLDVDHSTTYLALLRCPGGGTLGTCGSSAGDPSAEQLEKAMAARFAEQGHAGYLRTPERTIEALVASPAVMAALEAGVRYGRVPPAAPAAIVAATRASPPLVAVTGPKSPPPASALPRSPAVAVRKPPSPATPVAPPAVVTPAVPPNVTSMLTFSLRRPFTGADVGRSYGPFSMCVPSVLDITRLCGLLPETTIPAGGVPPYQFFLDTAGGFLPPGLELTPNGILRGTPQASAAGRTWAFGICAMDTTLERVCDRSSITVGAVAVIATPEPVRPPSPPTVTRPSTAPPTVPPTVPPTPPDTTAMAATLDSIQCGPRVPNPFSVLYDGYTARGTISGPVGTFVVTIGSLGRATCDEWGSDCKRGANEPPTSHWTLVRTTPPNFGPDASSTIPVQLAASAPGSFFSRDFPLRC